MLHQFHAVECLSGSQTASVAFVDLCQPTCTDDYHGNGICDACMMAGPVTNNSH